MPSLTGLVCFSGNVLLETYRAYRHSVTGMDCELSLSEVLSRVSDGMSIARTIPSKFKVPEGRHYAFGNCPRCDVSRHDSPFGSFDSRKFPKF